jgi:membrane dipeptidase
MRLLVTLLILLGTMSCGKEIPDNTEANGVGKEIVAPGTGSLANRYLLVDTHIDTPFRLLRSPVDIAVQSTEGQFDYARARAGGLDVAFMSIYIPAQVEEEGGAKQMGEQLIDLIESVVSQNPEQFVLVTSTTQVFDNFPDNRVMLAMGMENGGPIEGHLENLQHFYDRGIRYITLTHSKSNHIADSSYDDNKKWKGLSDFGKTLVAEMNKVGMIIDISHLSDDAFYQVLEITRMPVVATHSSTRHFVPGFERNLSDDMIVAMGRNGGVIQVNFGSGFISQKSRLNGLARDAEMQQYLEAHKIERDSEEGRAFSKSFAENWNYQYASMSDLLDHFDHIRSLIGVDHIGFGSDFDGVGDSLPVGIKDVSDYPNLIQGLVERGYSDEDIVKIMGGNFMRVWQQVEQGRVIH